jgi:2-haloacid dehalogenase
VTLADAGFEAVTFDCYGTLIDWERGILTALGPLLDRGGVDIPPDEALLELFGRLEPAAEAGPFRSYRSVLEEVARGFGEELGVPVTDGGAAAFAASVGEWPPFPDSPGALRALADRFRLAVVSNVDDDLFEASAARLGVRFDEVVTAAQVRSYKPAHAHFEEVLRRLDLPRDRVLHVAGSLYHDIVPARELGISCVWVNRREGRPGGGASRPAEVRPDHECSSLTEVVELLRAG